MKRLRNSENWLMSPLDRKTIARDNWAGPTLIPPFHSFSSDAQTMRRFAGSAKRSSILVSRSGGRFVIRLVCRSVITSTFTGPRRNSLFPKAARPAAPCATHCYHAIGVQHRCCLFNRVSAMPQRICTIKYWDRDRTSRARPKWPLRWCPQVFRSDPVYAVRRTRHQYDPSSS